MNRNDYVHPLGSRYASAAMADLLSPQRRVEVWRRLWLALAETQAELGLDISPNALAEMRTVLKSVDLERAAEYESKLRHDVMAHVHLLGDDAPAARGIIHLGATSAFITDNADLLVTRDALHLIRSRVVRCLLALAEFADRYAALPTLGYTHFQTAQPTTVGKRATLWAQDLLLDLEELEHRTASLRFRGAKGTTGTQASFLELFDGDGNKVDALDRTVSRKMGFHESYAVTGQTYPRKVDQAVAATLAGVGVSLSKSAHDIRLLSHLQELEEPFGKNQVGSSAMPYKRNPMRSERICALARHVIVLAQDPAVTAATQWLERTLDDSANRRVSLNDAFLALDGALVVAENVFSGLVVNEGVIARRLDAELPYLVSETLLMRASARGGDRQRLHERIRIHALASRAVQTESGGSPDVLDRIASDAAFGSVDPDEIEAVRTPAAAIGRAPDQVARFLEGLRPAIAPFLEEAKSLEDASLRV